MKPETKARHDRPPGVALQRLVMRLRREIETLEDENAGLEYWAELQWRWAAAHCKERMADFERHREELRSLLKLRQYDGKRYAAFLRRKTREMVAGWRKSKTHNTKLTHD